MNCSRLLYQSKCWAMCVALVGLTAGVAGADNKIPVTGEGTGVYYPETGMYTAEGDVDPFGKSVGTGRVETEPTGPTSFTFQNFGNRTKDEVLERIIVADGTIFDRSEAPGTVELIPDLTDPNFDPLVGPYTAQWEANLQVVNGTGRFRGAKGEITVTATNLPFLLTDTEWHFTWTWEGVIKVPPRN